jgi:hypothetical protein
MDLYGNFRGFNVSVRVRTLPFSEVAQQIDTRNSQLLDSGLTVSSRESHNWFPGAAGRNYASPELQRSQRRTGRDRSVSLLLYDCVRGIECLIDVSCTFQWLCSVFSSSRS